MKPTIEALLFATKEPLPLQKLSTILQQPLESVRQALDELQSEYAEPSRAFQIDEIAGGFLLRTKPCHHPVICQLLAPSRPRKLSPAALETLSIIAYKQPLTRAQLEQIRGVDSGGVIDFLQERDLVEPQGKLEVPGRPTLYGTTKGFLQHFGLNSLADLPPLPTTG